MQLGFVSAILPELTLEEILSFAATEGFRCVELMCWPVGKAERRYAGVTHLDVTSFGESEATRTRELVEKYGVRISSLGYYPNPLSADPIERENCIQHLRRVIEASAGLGIGVVTTFVGRDHVKSVEENWKLFESVWKPLISFAADQDVKVGIENCPMLFSGDEWPGGKNLAISPEIWRRMFDAIPSKHFGLNFDPSHLVWQKIDYVRALHEFKDRIVHVHAKDDKTVADRLYDRGVLGLGWHIPKLPGLGDVQWNQFFSALTDIEYRGPVCVEIEDRAYEYSLEGRQKAIRQSQQYLKHFFA
ncbi:MAG: sugar phosphate isomerase/epimerase [Verrucomicrobia bacterium]|nr:sugar phosphate isomerase/epimerase [Verrucomicrobiota bacterium]